MGWFCSGDSNLKSRAVRCINLILRHDRYSGKIMLDALSRTDFRRTSEYDEMVASMRPAIFAKRESQGSLLQAAYRHCDEQGRLVHILTGGERNWNKLPSKSCQNTCATEHEMFLNIWDLLIVRNVAETPIELAPIFVGHLPDGRKAYLAEIYNPVHKMLHWTYDEVDNLPSGATIPIVRYPDDTYDGSRSFYRRMQEPESGNRMDPTGPYSWVFVKDLPRLKEISDTITESDDTKFSDTSLEEVIDTLAMGEKNSRKERLGRDVGGGNGRA